MKKASFSTLCATIVLALSLPYAASAQLEDSPTPGPIPAGDDKKEDTKVYPVCVNKIKDGVNHVICTDKDGKIVSDTEIKVGGGRIDKAVTTSACKGKKDGDKVLVPWFEEKEYKGCLAYKCTGDGKGEKIKIHGEYVHAGEKLEGTELKCPDKKDLPTEKAPKK